MRRGGEQDLKGYTAEAAPLHFETEDKIYFQDNSAEAVPLPIESQLSSNRESLLH